MQNLPHFRRFMAGMTAERKGNIFNNLQQL